MRKTILLLAILLIPTLVKAESINPIDVLKKIPEMKQGIAFDVAEGEFKYITTTGIAKYDNFGLDVGFASDSKLVATLSYDIGGLKQIGIDTPITNLIDLRVGIYAGYGRLTGDNEFSWGPEVTIINVKF